jgi:ferric-dicitrate binding protein FerR (iron transport regulator)
MELSEIGGRCRVRLLLDGSVDITVFQGFVTLRRAGRGQLDVEHLDVEGCAHVHIKGTTPHVEQLHRHLELPQWVQERSALGKSIPVVESEALREARQEQAIARMAALPRILTSATAFNELSDWLRRDETHLTLFRENYTANKQAKIDQTSLDKSRLQRLARAPLIPQQALFSDESLHTARKSAAVADPEQALGWLQKLIAAENADTIDAELGAWLRVSPTRRDLYFEFFSLWNYLLHTRLKVLLAGGLQAPPLPDIATLNARGLREFAIAEALREQQVDRVMACEFPQPQESVSAAQPQFVGQLPDDSHLILAPLSRVRRNYTYGRREITLLQGMMVMNLKPSPCQPFFLRVGELEACGDSGVLGARVLQDAVWLWSQVGSFSVRHMTDKPNSTPLNGCECVELSAQGLRWRPISDVEVIGLQHGLSPP